MYHIFHDTFLLYCTVSISFFLRGFHLFIIFLFSTCISVPLSKTKICVSLITFVSLLLRSHFNQHCNQHCIKLYIRKVLKNGKRLAAYFCSLRGACFTKYRFLNLHILHFCCFIPCLGLKIIPASSCIYEKR